jgi:4'-phosphopantetheinyl transferase EntD
MEDVGKQRRPATGARPASQCVLADLLPDTVTVAASSTGMEAPPLFPEEETYISRAVARRAREFALGRYCARLALARLGISPQAILVGHDRQPKWPNGLVGSITHCDGFCAAASARVHDVAGLGIDAELATPLPVDIVRLVCTERERNEAAGSSLHTKLLFSAKESFFKCTFPLTRRFLDFLDAEVSLAPDGTFAVSSSVADARQVAGRYAVTEQYVFTTAVIYPREGLPRTQRERGVARVTEEDARVE